MEHSGIQSILRLLRMDQATLKVKGIYKNGDRYSAKIRIPKDLKKHYPNGKTWLQKPLGTPDYIEAIKRATPILEQWRKDFQRLRAGKPPSQNVLQLHPIGKDLAQAIGDAELESDVVDARFQNEAERRARDVAKKTGKSLSKDQIQRLAEGIYRDNSIELESVMNPAEIRLLKGSGQISLPLRLSDALDIYLSTHDKGDKRSVQNMARYSIDGLIASQGDLVIADPNLNVENSITRRHLQAWIKEMVANGLKTETAQRRLNHVKAILKRVALERQIPNIDFIVEGVGVVGVGSDSKKKHVPSPEELGTFLRAFKDDPVATLLVFLGGRISEVTGLMMSDLHLNEKQPFISIKPNSVRELKTANSIRDIPVFGRSLEALQEIITKHSDSTYLLPQYASERGGSNASGAMNKRFKARGFPNLTTHCFRHALKDLLRNSNCPESLLDEIQGHGTQTAAKNYGKGSSLERKAKALAEAYSLIPA